MKGFSDKYVEVDFDSYMKENPAAQVVEMEDRKSVV